MTDFILIGQFRYQILTAELFEEAFECFLKGYLKSHPVFNALKFTEQEFTLYFKEKLRYSLEQRPAQQIVVLDTKNNNKVVGVYHIMHFPEDQPNVNADFEKAVFKNELNERLLNCPIADKLKEEIKSTQNPFLYQQAYSSILPEYQSFGIYQKLNELEYYISKKLGVRAFVVPTYNIKLVQHSLKNGYGEVINEVDINNEQFNGEYVFRKIPYICSKLVVASVENEFSEKIEKKYDQQFKPLFQKYIDLHYSKIEIQPRL